MKRLAATTVLALLVLVAPASAKVGVDYHVGLTLYRLDPGRATFDASGNPDPAQTYGLRMVCASSGTTDVQPLYFPPAPDQPGQAKRYFIDTIVIMDTVPGDACTAWIYQSIDPSTPVSAAVTFTAI